MQTHTITTYQFSELSPEAQREALDNCRDWNVASEYWSGYSVECAKDAGKLLGIDIDNVYFSGFWSQGDGACFTGSYAYKKGSVKAIKDEFPMADELHAIAQNLQDIQKLRFYRLTADVTHSGRYYHAYSTDMQIFDNGEYASDIVHDAIKECLQDFMNWIYRMLEAEYDDLTSDACVRESIEANELEFNADGSAY